MQKLIPFIPFLPFLGFVINGLWGKQMPKRVSGIIGSAAVLLSFLLSLGCFFQLGHEAALDSSLYTFFSVDNLHVNFGFLVDRLSAWMMLIVTGIGFLIHLYSMGYMKEDAGFARFFAYLNLFIFSMLLLVMGNNYVMLFFGWEGVGLCSYLLIGFWYENKEFGAAARKAFIMNRIGDLGLLLGMFLLFKTFGSLDYKTVFGALSSYTGDATSISIICLLLFVGAIGKSAQLPLYTWLPDAMAGPTPVSALIHAATMVTAGIYLIARSSALYNLAPLVLELIAVVGLATSIFAALIGLRQNDIKKVLAYSTVSQLGLMFLALGMGGYVTAMFHVTTHAFFKALLFLGAGSVIHAMGGEQDIRNMGGLRKAMPITFWVFLIGSFAISGFPLLAGFFSKDEIFAQTHAMGGMLWWGLAVASGLLTAVYMSRLLFLTFFGEFRGTSEQKHHLHESPLVMTAPLMVLAVLSVFGGFLNTPHFMGLGNSEWMAHFLESVVQNRLTEGHEASVASEWLMMGFTTALALGAIGIAYWVYVVRGSRPVADAEQRGLSKVLAHKFYVDEIYQALIVTPIERLSKVLHYYGDIWAIDGLVNGVGRSVGALGAVLQQLQNGSIGYYLLAMALGMVALLGTLFL